MKEKKAIYYLDCYKTVQKERTFWLNQWQLVSEFVHQRRADFTTSRTAGAFITQDLWSDAPVHMAETSASALLGYIWSAGEKSFRLRENEKVFKSSPEMKSFWAEATETVQEEMGEREAGLASALDEAMLDLVTLGTAAIITEEKNIDAPDQPCLVFEPWSVQQFSLDEDASNRAVKFYREREYGVEQHVEKYGLENVSKKAQDLFKQGKSEAKIKVLHVIEPRRDSERKKNSKAAKDMPIASVHIEVDTQHICKLSGYPELPIACARLAKRLGEKYGRGRAMNALPSIMMLNQVEESYMLAEEIKNNPPLYQINDSVSGSGFVDRSAGGMTTIKLDKAITNFQPIGKLFDFQQTNGTKDVIERLIENISNHFMIDRLINMNNDQQMTAREALLRNAIRQGSLRSIVSRILAELFELLVTTSFNICLRRGRFGYMPNDPVALAMEQDGKEVKYLPKALLKAMQEGKNLYTIEYLTPAARDLMAEEGQGMLEVLETAGQIAQFDQTIPDRIDAQWTLSRLAEIRGANYKMFRKEEDVNKILQDRQQAAQQQQQAQLMQQGAGVAKDMAMAQNAMQQ